MDDSLKKLFRDALLTGDSRKLQEATDRWLKGTLRTDEYTQIRESGEIEGEYPQKAHS